MPEQNVKRAFRILKTKFAVTANDAAVVPDLFFSAAFESLLTDFHKVEPLEYTDGLDFEVVMTDRADTELKLLVNDRGINLAGPILEATQNCSDLRFTMFGNEGLLFRYALMFMEKRYDTYSFHACSLYDPQQNRMYIAPGRAGSGKTCLILKGLELGLKIFSTEMTHFSFEDGLTLFKGSLIDNIRVGNLKYSYPTVPEKLNLKLPDTEDEWGKKIAVDLSAQQTAFDKTSSAKITFVIPHIEEARSECIAIDIKDKRVARKALFNNLSDKITENVVIYDDLLVTGLDNPELAKRRFDAAGRILDRSENVARLIAGSQNCWDGILKK